MILATVQHLPKCFIFIFLQYFIHQTCSKLSTAVFYKTNQWPQYFHTRGTMVPRTISFIAASVQRLAAIVWNAAKTAKKKKKKISAIHYSNCRKLDRLRKQQLCNICPIPVGTLCSGSKVRVTLVVAQHADQRSRLQAGCLLTQLPSLKDNSLRKHTRWHSCFTCSCPPLCWCDVCGWEAWRRESRDLC